MTREEVTVERRPATARHAKGDISEDEIVVPVLEEEVVVEKRMRPKEEVVIKKHTVRDEKTVEADLRRSGSMSTGRQDGTSVDATDDRQRTSLRHVGPTARILARGAEDHG